MCHLTCGPAFLGTVIHACKSLCLVALQTLLSYWRPFRRLELAIHSKCNVSLLLFGRLASPNQCVQRAGCLVSCLASVYIYIYIYIYIETFFYCRLHLSTTVLFYLILYIILIELQIPMSRLTDSTSSNVTLETMSDYLNKISTFWYDWIFPGVKRN